MSGEIVVRLPAGLPAGAAEAGGGGGAEAKLLELWLRRQRSSCTRRAYAKDWRLFRQKITAPLEAITALDMEDYAAHLAQRGLAPGSQHAALAGIRSFFSYCVKIGHLKYDVTRVLRLPKGRKAVHERILTYDQVCDLINAAGQIGKTELARARNRLLVELLYVSAMRRSELESLRWGNLTPLDGEENGAGQLEVVGKGEKHRPIKITPITWQELVSRRGNAGDDEPIFVGAKGRGLSDSQIYRIVREAGEKAGIKKRVFPHMLRHTHATEATKAPGFDLRLLQESMGHESLDTTGRYMHVQPGKGSADFLRPIRRTPPPPLAGVAAEIRNSNG